MPHHTHTLPSTSEAAFYRRGLLTLYAVLGFSLCSLLYLTWKAPTYLSFFPILLAGIGGLWYLLRHPLLNLALILFGFILVADHQEGIQITEAIYGLYYLSYLAFWFLSRLFFYRDRVLDTPGSIALFLLIVWATLTIPLSLLSGGNARWIFSEWVAMATLLLYFPIREGFARYKRMPEVVIALVLIIGSILALRNLYEYQQGLSDATQAWQIIRGRAVTNDSILMSISLIGLIFLLHAERWHYRLMLLIAFLLNFVGLLLTQSRAFWVTFLLGAGLLFVFFDRRHKTRLIGLVLIGSFGALAFGIIFFEEYISLIISGLIERISSLGSAASRDISLINRFHETQTVWERIIQNPVIGYGMGVPYRFFDLTRHSTDVDSFVHNGYLSLWYRLGLPGLTAILVLWVSSIWQGFTAYRTTNSPLLTRLCGLSTAITLTVLALPALTSNPFHRNDGTFLFALLAGIAAGTYERLKCQAPVRSSNDLT